MDSSPVFNRYQQSTAAVNEVIEKIRVGRSSSQFDFNLAAEITKIGFRRVLVSRVENSKWIVEGAYSENGQKEVEAILRTGRMKPYQDISTLFEGEAASMGLPVLRSAKSDPTRVHSRLHEVIKSQVYVVAPVIVDGRTIGLIHADENRWTGSMDTFDRDLIGLVSQFLGMAIERESSLRDFLGLCDDIAAESASIAAPHQPPLSQILTAREMEVCHYMAQGKTNRQIGAILYIAEYTVKTHVQNILQKLGASNRSEAVYLAQGYSSSPVSTMRDLATA